MATPGARVGVERSAQKLWACPGGRGNPDHYLSGQPLGEVQATKRWILPTTTVGRPSGKEELSLSAEKQGRQTTARPDMEAKRPASARATPGQRGARTQGGYAGCGAFKWRQHTPTHTSTRTYRARTRRLMARSADATLATTCVGRQWSSTPCNPIRCMAWVALAMAPNNRDAQFASPTEQDAPSSRPGHNHQEPMLRLLAWESFGASDPNEMG